MRSEEVVLIVGSVFALVLLLFFICHLCYRGFRAILRKRPPKKAAKRFHGGPEGEGDMSKQAKPSLAQQIFWFWPSMETLQIAHNATRHACSFALIVAVVTSILSILAIGGVHIFEHIGAWSLLDAALFGAIAVGLYRHSRVAALAGLVLYVLGQVYMLSEGTVPTYKFWWLVPLCFTLAFFHGVRGAFAYHRLKRAAAQEQGDENKDAAKGDLP